jgi:uncharacterized protein YecT (DUF1311 family)
MQSHVLGLVAVAAATLAAVPATAADDADTVTACIEGERQASRDGRACIGRVSDPCLKDTAAETTVAMVECLDRESAAWDKVLNADYQQLLKGLNAPAAESVRNAQRAWIALRDADCKVPYDIFEGGTIAHLDSATCVQNHTATRVLQLRDWRQMSEADE